MISLETKNLNLKELNRLMIGSILPRPIAFVSSLSADGVLNLAPFSYFNIVSSEPPLLSISILHRTEGTKYKDTINNVRNNNEFVVHIVSEDVLHDVNETSIEIPSNRSELLYTRLSIMESNIVKVPQIKECKVRMECVVEKIVELPNSDLLIGRVVNFNIDESVYNKGRINLEALKPMSRLSGSQYGKVGNIINMERPK